MPQNLAKTLCRKIAHSSPWDEKKKTSYSLENGPFAIQRESVVSSFYKDWEWGKEGVTTLMVEPPIANHLSNSWAIWGNVKFPI